MTPLRAAAHPLDQATVEQLLRWQVLDSYSGDGVRTTRDAAAARAAVQAAHGTRDQFAQAVAELARQAGPASIAYWADQALQGNQLSNDAVGHNAGLKSLYRTVLQRADGADVAEITTVNGLRLRAEHTGEAYQTGVLVEDSPGRSDVLARGTVAASSATQALRITAEREHAAHGLDQTDLRLIRQQLARLEQLTVLGSTGAGQGTAGPGGNRWAATEHSRTATSQSPTAGR